MKISVFGAGGFIGRNLTQKLVKLGHDVVAFDRQFHFPLSGAKLVRGSFQNQKDVVEAMKGCDLLYFLITTSSPLGSMSTPLLEIETMLQPTIEVFNLAKSCQVKRICFTSSAGSIYGHQNDLITEETLPKPISPHAIVKQTIESYLRYFETHHQIGFDIFRISNAYGPGQVYQPGGVGVIAHWIDLILQNKSIEIWGDGSQSKDFVYVDDITDFMSQSCSRLNKSGDIFNLCSGRNHTLVELIEIIQTITNKDIKVKFIENAIGDVKSNQLSNNKILNLKVNHQFCMLEDGIQKMWDFASSMSDR